MTEPLEDHDEAALAKTPQESQEQTGLSTDSPPDTDLELEAIATSIDQAPDAILKLHRDPDGFIGFARKTTEGWEELAAIRAGDLQEFFPALAPWLFRDAYFTVNPAYRAHPWKEKHAGTGFLLPWTGKKPLRRLNACYADLDVGRSEHPDPIKRMTWAEAAAQVQNLADAGTIPQPSIYAKSGQGLYVFWILRDDKDQTMPPSAWPEIIPVYENINKALQEPLKNLALDDKAWDAARVLRVPATHHSENGETAAYFFPANARMKGFTYTLRELAGRLDVRYYQQSLPDDIHAELERPFYGRRIKNRGSAPKRCKGYQTRSKLRAADLATIAAARGGWLQGSRKFWLSWYAAFLKGAEIPKAQVRRAVQKMAENCRPPYPSDPNDSHLAKIIRQAAPRIPNTAKLVNWLDLSPKEARRLNLKTILPSEVRDERKPPFGGLRKQQRAFRRARIKVTLSVNPGHSYTVDEMRAVLEKFGIQASRDTINRDLNYYGHIPAPGSRGRPRKQRD